jgi:hypothetical protein
LVANGTVPRCAPCDSIAGDGVAAEYAAVPVAERGKRENVVLTLVV